MNMLMIFGGLPGVGKTTIARSLAGRSAACYVRMDSIEQSIRGSKWGEEPLDDVGYRVGYAVAEENLRLGRTVIADFVNPLGITRDTWMEMAKPAGVGALEVEIVCSDANEHRKRLELRATDISGLRPLGWQEVMAREYQAWEREPVVIDTSRCSVDESVQLLLAALGSYNA